MKRFAILAGLAAFAIVAGTSAAQTSAAVTHSEFQAVDTQGEHVYAATDKVTLEGILLHHPADMLDPTPDDTITQMFNLGGAWQIFFQGEGDDHAGTSGLRTGRRVPSARCDRRSWRDSSLGLTR